MDKAGIRSLSKYATVVDSTSLDETSIVRELPSVDAILLFFWPKYLTRENLSKMNKLRFLQSILAGVNHIPFAQLGNNVAVSSNAGAYSEEVAEYAWSLLLSAAKRVVDFHNAIKTDQWKLRRTLGGREVTILHGRTLGILGYGGIGAIAARMGKTFGMRIFAYSRHTVREKNVRSFCGEEGLSEVLAGSDAIILSLPLTKSTTKIIDQSKLALVKKDAILVNIARGELVDEPAMYEYLRTNPEFRYATDVWWYQGGRESLKTSYPFFDLPNFVGTPHVSGPSGLATGQPVKLAVENTIRYLRGQTPKNIVDKNEYLFSDRQDY